jgi:hypothetical protein
MQIQSIYINEDTLFNPKPKRILIVKNKMLLSSKNREEIKTRYALIELGRHVT